MTYMGDSFFDPRARPCKIAFDQFDHLSVTDAERIFELRKIYPDWLIATKKGAHMARIELPRLVAYLRRNARPKAELA
jgi:hypothetical protein